MPKSAGPAAPFRLDARFRKRARSSALLHAERANGVAFEIREDTELRWFTASGRIVQSLMCKARPDDIVLPNQLAMLAGLLWRAKAPTRVLNLGFGSGMFERFFHARLPKCEVVSVEIEPAMVTLARRYFGIPADWPVIVEDAARYLERSELGFDFIVCDIFADECHPDCLFDPYFHAAAAKRLRRTGALALNVSPTSDDDLREILAALRQSVEWVVLAPVPDHGNVVVFASRCAPPDDAQLSARASAFEKATGVDLHPYLAGIERLPARSSVIGGNRRSRQAAGRVFRPAIRKP